MPPVMSGKIASRPPHFILDFSDTMESSSWTTDFKASRCACPVAAQVTRVDEAEFRNSPLVRLSKPGPSKQVRGRVLSCKHQPVASSHETIQVRSFI
jgi:hypothetical protein